MSLELEIIKEDLKVARKYLGDNNFDYVNIIANRIMSNLLVAEGNDKILMTIGWILRDISGEMNLSKGYKDKSKISNAVNEAKTSLDKLIDILAKNEQTEQKILEIYFNYQKRVRKYLLPVPEDSVYTIKPEFTRKVNLMMFKHLSDNQEILIKENNTLIKGIINDLSRCINEHGAKEADYISYLVFRVFDSYYDYVLYSEIGIDGKIKNVESLKSKLSIYIERIEKIVPMMDNDLEELCKYCVNILVDLAIEFRKNYMNYMPIYTPAKKIIEMPEEAKKKIGETIAKAFEEEAT